MILFNFLATIIILFFLSQTFLSRGVGYIFILLSFLYEFLSEIPYKSIYYKEQSFSSFYLNFRLTRPVYSHIYSYSLSITMFFFIIIFAPTIPFILPFGVLYFIISIYTDRILLILLYKKGKSINGYQIIRKSTYVLLFYLIIYLLYQLQFLNLFLRMDYMVIVIVFILLGVLISLITCCVLCCIPRLKKQKRTKLEDTDNEELYKQPFYDDYFVK